MKQEDMIPDRSSKHPWGIFLLARMKMIQWLKVEFGYSDSDIASTLSMDETQVFLIRTAMENEFNDLYK